MVMGRRIVCGLLLVLIGLSVRPANAGTCETVITEPDEAPAMIDSIEITDWKYDPQTTFVKNEPIFLWVDYYVSDGITSGFDGNQWDIDVEFPVKALLVLKVGQELFTASRLLYGPDDQDDVRLSIRAGSCQYIYKNGQAKPKVKVQGQLKIFKKGKCIMKYVTDVQTLTVTTH